MRRAASLPPTPRPLSTTIIFGPFFASLLAALKPARPDPIINVSNITGSLFIIIMNCPIFVEFAGTALNNT